MKKIGLTVIVILILFCAICILLTANYTSRRAKQVSNPGNKEKARATLMSHYSPGSCYGMPGPRLGSDGTEILGPDITISKDDRGWDYALSDGQCCQITNYTGTISEDYDIMQTGVKSYKTAC